MTTYEAVTRGIRVAVEPNFLPDESEPEENRYFWSYRVTIENQGTESVQLISRYWRITDARGRLHERKGAGVVGEQPTIAPGKAFEYTSGAPLETTSGFMTGTYRMRSQTGDFDVEIPLFALESPYEVKRMH